MSDLMDLDGLLALCDRRDAAVESPNYGRVTLTTARVRSLVRRIRELEAERGKESMNRYRIDTWGTKDGYRFEVLDGNGAVAYKGWGRDEDAARRMAQRWVDRQQPPSTSTGWARER